MNDEKVMSECINYAASFSGFTKSNPLVAAALVDKHNNILSMGAHKSFGDKHAEINLIDTATDTIKNGKVFITLEPCSTFGKTPPCVDRLIEVGVKKVVIALLDPNPKNYGIGIKKLLEAGIEVKLGVGADKAATLIKPFIKSQISEYPFVTAKIAMSLDGAIATRLGVSQWITSTSSRHEVHRLRLKSDAVLTGIGTVINDDPMLNCRLDNPLRQPTRVILDSTLRIPHQSNIVKTAKNIKTIIFTTLDENNDRFKQTADYGIDVYNVSKDKNGKLDIRKVLTRLKSMDIINILLESGANLLGSFNDMKLIDRYMFFIAPIIIGGKDSMHSVAGIGVDKLDNINDLEILDITKNDRDIIIDTGAYDYTSDIIAKTFKMRDELCLQE